MKSFDVLVIGSGSGMHIVERALSEGMKVALVEMGPLGGTCLNRGCIPSKILTYTADVINLIRNSERLGVKARIERVDFPYIMKRMRSLVESGRSHMEEGVRRAEGLTFYNAVGEFIDDYTMSVSGEKIRAENIFIVSGSRSLIPPIKGLEKIDYLTTENVWQLEEAPESIIFIGGGYVAVEFSHFFSSIGSKVTVISRSPRILKNAEPEISKLLENAMRRRMKVYTGLEAVEVNRRGSMKSLTAREVETGRKLKFSTEAIFIASGRRSNADLLRPERTGVELDERGYIKVNEYLETSKERVWAFGDAIGKHMFKHVANYEAGIAWHNFIHPHKIPVDYSSVPYAVFGDPQVASVGLTEAEARRRGYEILVGRYDYRDTAKGEAMDAEEGFVKVIIDAKRGRILGTHIIGPLAPELIQEVINVMNCGDGSYRPIMWSMHIHPALSEVVQFAFNNLHRH
ncbi:dihydrolipoyl dehydrogenase [Candidatus Bathyarchaeota archaeon]|nr:dihydrolipoyl dehydrogenase [Candidatus Bathyarchaeota archaeon]